MRATSKFWHRTQPKMEPRKLLSRLRQRMKDGGLEVLAGHNADEGAKALMYFSPHLFPNREIIGRGAARLSRHEFSSTVERIFAHLSKQVGIRNLMNAVHSIRPGLPGPKILGSKIAKKYLPVLAGRS